MKPGSVHQGIPHRPSGQWLAGQLPEHLNQTGFYHAPSGPARSTSDCNILLGGVLAKSTKNCRHDLQQRGAIRFGRGEKERTFFDLLGNELEIGRELKRSGDVAEFVFVDLPVQERSAQSVEVTRCQNHERTVASDEDWARTAALSRTAPMLRH